MTAEQDDRDDGLIRLLKCRPQDIVEEVDRLLMIEARLKTLIAVTLEGDHSAMSTNTMRVLLLQIRYGDY